jgi:hypothetical protein
MSQTSCRRCGYPVPIRWLRAGGDLSRPNPIPQSAVRPLMRSERPPKCLLHSSDLASPDIEVVSRWRAAHHRDRRGRRHRPKTAQEFKLRRACASRRARRDAQLAVGRTRRWFVVAIRHQVFGRKRRRVRCIEPPIALPSRPG